MFAIFLACLSALLVGLKIAGIAQIGWGLALLPLLIPGIMFLASLVLFFLAAVGIIAATSR